MALHSPEQQLFIDRIEADLRAHMEEAKPRRFAHSLSVAAMAEEMALAYGADPFEARVAGTLHDWDKVLSGPQLKDDARRYGIDMGVELELVVPLLHGLTAAERLRGLYPELSPEVLDAIRTHTIGGIGLTDLSKIVFVADVIEPLRADAPDIALARGMFERREPLDELFFTVYARSAAYVLETGRYLYPATIETYNALALERARRQ